MSQSTNFGAVVVPSPYANKQPTANLESPILTPAVSSEDLHQTYTNKPIPPHSPFYQHPPASFEKVHSRQGSRTNFGTPSAAPTEKDVELGATTPLAVPASHDDHPFASKVSVDCSKECRMWPSKNTLMQDQEQRRKQKRSKRTMGNVTGPVVEFWNRFTKRQKLYIQIVTGLLLVGVAVAIAVGITVAVNGTVYVGEDRSKTIPDPNEQ